MGYLIAIGSLSNLRLLGEVGKSFGGFYWAVNTDGKVVIISTVPKLTNFDVKTHFIGDINYKEGIYASNIGLCRSQVGQFDMKVVATLAIIIGVLGCWWLAFQHFSHSSRFAICNCLRAEHWESPIMTFGTLID
ncbi:hypothetical protein KSC_044810 [Ktedonobacter sp. SOSP1-52]|nr:hypothetical protein KSC_044810 [Ktedonobacter sp. SOSP1-52]